MQSPSDSPNIQMVCLFACFLSSFINYCTSQASSEMPRKRDQPSLPLLLEFPGQTRRLNIIEEIGTRYRMLCPLLLNDTSGAITKAITQQFQNNAIDINFEILTQWIQGKGRAPVTWETLVEVLKRIALAELAREINDSLR